MTRRDRCHSRCMGSSNVRGKCLCPTCHGQNHGVAWLADQTPHDRAVAVQRFNRELDQERRLIALKAQVALIFGELRAERKAERGRALALARRAG